MIRSWVLGNEAHENRNGVLLFILLCVSEKYMSFNERSDIYDISTGTEFLDDDKFYRLEFHAKGLIQAIRVKIAFKRNKKFKYYTY